LTVVGKREVILDGQAISYIIKRSPRAKYVRLEVRPETGLTVVIPKSYELDQLSDLLKQKSCWILGKLAKYGQVSSTTDRKELKSGDTIPYLGYNLRVVTRQLSREAESVRLERNRLIVNTRPGSARFRLALEGWYRMQAEKLLRQKVDKLSTRLGVRYNRVIIRGQKTRWGSCSQKGNLSFNWKLIMAPEPVIDYVIIHELAHLKEMNHTKRFWHMVAEYCPGWREHREWLKEHATELAARLPA